METKPAGVHAARLKQGPWEDLERAFAETWQQEVNFRTLAYLMHPMDSEYDQFSDEAPSERDYEVAATVVQWLGSNVGRGFLEAALKKVGLRIEGDYSGHLASRYGEDWAAQ